MQLLAIAFVIILAAATMQAVTGFGFALVAVPLLAATTDPRTAVVGAKLVGTLLAMTMVARERASVRWPTAALVVGAAILAMPVGLLVLRGTSERTLTELIAIVALARALAA